MRSACLLLCLASSLFAQSPEQLFRQGKYDEARAAFQAQLAKNKNDANALYYIGRIAAAQDKVGEAIGWFEKAVKQSDTTAIYHLWLGNALGEEAQNANKLRQPFIARRVKSEFERAVALDPKLIDAREGLADFYSMAPGVMGGSKDKARAQIEEIKKLHPYRGYFKEARLAQREKDAVAEGKAYEAAVKAAPDSLATHYQLASYYRRQSKFDEAFAIYESIMLRKPDEIPVRASYGVTASLSGKNLDRGEREIRAYLASPPENAPQQALSFVRYHLGQIYEKTARKDAAKAEYSEAVKLNKDNADARKALSALK